VNEQPRRPKKDPKNFTGTHKRKGGFDGERTRTEARYQKTRDARKAFGTSSKASAAMRHALSDYTGCIRDRYLAGRLLGLFQQIRGCSDPETIRPAAIPGLETAEGRALLLQFEFQKGRKLSRNLKKRGHADPATGTFQIQHLTPMHDLAFPKGTQTAGLQFLLLRLDANTLTCHLETSSVALFEHTDATPTDLTLTANVPNGNGPLFGLVFSGFCDVFRGELRWSVRKETVLGFVGVEDQ
jgi:hypothetical protein